MRSFKNLILSASTIAIASMTSAAFAADIVWWTPNWSQDRAAEVAKRFEAKFPQHKVKLEITVSDGLQNRVLVALRSGAAPDVIDVQHGWVNPFAEAGGGLAPLDDVFAKAKLDKADFHQAALNLVQVGGKIYGLPYRVESHALIYNKAMFREAGLDPNAPLKTWPELVEAAKKLTKTIGGKQQYGYGITGGGEFGNTVFRSLPLIWMNGGSLLSDDMKSVIVNQKPAVEAVEFYTNMLVKEKVSPPSTLQNDGLALRRLFIAGSLAMYQSGQFDLPVIKKEAASMEVGAMPLPAPVGKQPAALLGGWSFVVPAASKNKEAAGEFIAFLAEPEIMGYYTDTFPARTSALSLPRFKDPDLAAFAAMLPFARPAPAHKAWVQITQAYFNHVQSVLAGQANAQKAMDAAATEIKDLMN